MKKTVPSNNAGRTLASNSLKNIRETKTVAKPGNLSTSRVKFKDDGNCKVINNKSVQFVRNTTIPVRKSHSTVSFTSSLQDKSNSNNNGELLVSSATLESDDVKVNSNIKLNVPELCSSLRFANKLLEQAVHDSKSAAHLTNSVEACSSNSSAKIKALRKVNIPFEEHIYRDLIDLKVTESDLFPDHEKRFRTKQIVRVKEKEPELSEFYEPLFNQEFVIKPDKIKVESEKIVFYNGFSVSDRMKQWES